MKFKIPIFIAILITYATNAQAIDQEKAKNQFSANTQDAETQLSDI